MNPPAEDEPETERSVNDAAGAWYAEREAGFAPGRAETFARWLDADPRHARAMARLEETRQWLDRMTDWREDGRFARRLTQLERSARTGRRRFAWLPLAAAAALAAGFFFLRSDGTGGEVAEMVHATAVGGYERVALPDGSTIELNGGSAVRVAFTAAERRVSLTAGEGHFKVAKDAARPFVVEAGGIAVRAVGTAFNVRLAPSAVEVVVTEGKVRVGEQGRRSEHPVLAELSAGEQVRVAPAQRGEKPAVRKLEPAAIQEALAWQSPRMVFVDTPLAAVVARFNRHSRVQLVIGDAALGDKRVGGIFLAEHVEAFVRLLEENGGLVADRSQPGRIVLRQAR